MNNMFELLREAREEILSLRRRNELLSAKVEMIDLFSVVLHTKPNYPSQGFGEDVAWKLQKEIDAIQPAAPETPTVLGAGKIAP